MGDDIAPLVSSDEMSCYDPGIAWLLIGRGGLMLCLLVRFPVACRSNAVVERELCGLRRLAMALAFLYYCCGQPLGTVLGTP